MTVMYFKEPFKQLNWLVDDKPPSDKIQTHKSISRKNKYFICMFTFGKVLVV